MNVSSREDSAFLRRLTAIVEAKLNDEQFGVSQLARDFGKSRSYIHRKLKSITNESLSHFIRRIRLEKALELLKQDKFTVAEIAYEVGFGSPSYFIKCFHEHYGFPPGEAKKKIVEEITFSDYGLFKAARNSIPPNLKTSSGLKKKKFTLLKLALVAGFCLIVSVGIWLFFFKSDFSIIVLPFENFSDEQEIEHFTEGIREDLLNDLYKITDLRVVSRTSADQFRNSQLSARQIARKMKVKYVLEGSVRLDEEVLRINTQLIKAHPFREEHVWSEKFDRKFDNFLGVQDEIALLVANNIKSSLSKKEIKEIQSSPTQSSKAYDYYLRARFLLHKANSEQRSGFNFAGVQNCLKYYQMAIDEDENFAEAYAGLANANFQLSAWNIIPSNEGFLKAIKLSSKAIEIDPDCAEAHCMLGAVYVWGQRKFEEGGKEYKTSIRLNPNFATSRQHYAHYSMITGEIKQARENIDRAIELEPNFWVVQNLNSWIYYFEEKYEKALEACSVASDYNPDFSSNHWLFVLNYAKLDEGEKMKEKLQIIANRNSKTDNYTEEIQRAFEEDGIQGLFYWMIDVNKNNPIRVEGLNGNPYFTAWWNAILGNKDEAIHWLEETMVTKQKPYHYLILIASNPDFDLLRDNPRFLKVIDDIGLTPYHVRQR